MKIMIYNSCDKKFRIKATSFGLFFKVLMHAYQHLVT